MTKKITKQEKIEAGNLLEQAKEILEGCIQCGMCKAANTITRATGEEQTSARAQAILIKNNILDQSLFEYPLDKAADFACPLELSITEAIRKARRAATIKNKGIKQNEQLLENIKKYGNPYGEEQQE